jgi:hypothetical protein
MEKIKSFYAKLNDIRDVEGVLVAISRLSQEGKSLAKSFDLRILENQNNRRYFLGY